MREAASGTNLMLRVRDISAVIDQLESGQRIRSIRCTVWSI